MKALHVTALCALLLGLGLPFARLAHGIPILGFTNATPWQLADRDCFFNGSYAAIWNTCDTQATSRKVLLSLPQLFTATLNVFYATATDKGSGSGTLPTCRAVVVANDNTFINQTALTTVGLTVTNLTGTIDITNGSYSTHFECDVFGGRYGVSNAFRTVKP